ncbi:Mismatch repair protein [Giardia lamblia P15]|uniref:DNA mismatch repair protein n=1 Tax=Giardia intestinalis (strain P15) TaxID=658858 RepID=E1F5N0_GIAIA|nr:Mismatch repair protein [Giardia lamblia P15]
MPKQLTLDFFVRKPPQSSGKTAIDLKPPESMSVPVKAEGETAMKSTAPFTDSLKPSTPQHQTQVFIAEPLIRRVRPGLEAFRVQPIANSTSASASPRGFSTPETSPQQGHLKASISPLYSSIPQRDPSTKKRAISTSDESHDDIGNSSQSKQVPTTGFTRQYISIRKRLDSNTVLYIRKGRFFELYEQDSIFGNVTMGLKLTRHASSMSMCGVPDYMLDKYIKLTLDSGKRAAIADEMPEMDKVEKVQKRQIIAVYSPGSVSSALLLGSQYGILYIEDRGSTDLDSKYLQFYDPLRRLVLVKLESCTMGEVIAWTQRLSPAEIIISSCVYELVHAQISVYFLGPIYAYDKLYATVCSTNLLWDISLDALESCPNLSPTFRYYLNYLLATDKRLAPIQQGDITEYLANITLSGIFRLPKNSSPIATVPMLTLSSLSILPLCSADSFARFEAVDSSVFEVYNNCVTREGSQMLKTWLMNPLYDIETIQLRQSAIKLFASSMNHERVEAVLTSLKAIGTSLYYLVLGCRSNCHFNSFNVLEQSTLSNKLFVQLLVTIIRTYSAAETLHTLLNFNEKHVQSNEMLKHFSSSNDCWKFLETLCNKVTSMFEIDTPQVMLKKDFKLRASSNEPNLQIADALLDRIEQRYVNYLNALAQTHRLASNLKDYPLATLAPATSTVKVYTLSPFPDRHLVIGDSLIPLAKQSHFAKLEGITQVSSTKTAGRFSVLDPLPNETIAAANLATRATESQSQYNQQALCRLLGIDIVIDNVTQDTEAKIELLIQALDKIAFRRLLELESFLIRRKNSILNTLKLDLLIFLFEHDDMIREMCSIFSQIDVLCCFSKLSRIYTHVPWSYPLFQPPVHEQEHILDISKAYHPIALKLSQARLKGWVPLDCNFQSNKMLVLTGCNMSGKSTAMRLIGIAVLLAQIGAPLPCSGMLLTPYNAILAKIGNEEDIRSTFQKETADCAQLLQEALHPEARSLFLLDEFGRGTDSTTGDALAEAVCRQLTQLNLRAVVSTHSPLMALKLEQDKRVQLCHMSYEITASGIQFRHTLCHGLCTRSFGSQVAKLAGFPEELLEQCDRHTRGFIYSCILSTMEAVENALT